LSATDPFNAVISWVDVPAEAKPGPLSGKTLLVKDLIDTAGISSREIWVARVDGSHARLVTRLPAVSTLPSWSPDGRSIAFQSNIHAGHFEIYTIGRNGRGLRRETMSAIDTIDPAWSPNGKEIAFSRDGAIWMVDRARRVRKVTSGGNDSTPAWRPVSQH